MSPRTVYIELSQTPIYRRIAQALGAALPVGLALGALAAVHRRMLLPAAVVLAVVAVLVAAGRAAMARTLRRLEVQGG